jgi:hypothetical protein
LVEEAVVAETIVVEANGIERPVPAGAAKLMVSAVPPTREPAVPENERAVPAVTELVATD